MIKYCCEIRRHGIFNTPKCPICSQKAKICNHITLLKVMLNPILRYFGREIVSVFQEDQFIRYRLILLKDKFNQADNP